jgi:hypothetical protein
LESETAIAAMKGPLHSLSDCTRIAGSPTRDVKAREAVPMSVEVDFALRELLVVRGVQVKTDRKHASTRKPP